MDGETNVPCAYLLCGRQDICYRVLSGMLCDQGTAHLDCTFRMREERWKKERREGERDGGRERERERERERWKIWKDLSRER